jgi:hypothetical protein
MQWQLGEENETGTQHRKADADEVAKDPLERLK